MTRAPGATTAAVREMGVPATYWLITPDPAATSTSAAVPTNSMMTRIHSGRCRSVSSSKRIRYLCRIASACACSVGGCPGGGVSRSCPLLTAPLWLPP